MAVRKRYRLLIECDTEAERDLSWPIDSLIYTIDTDKYYKQEFGDWTEVPVDEIFLTSLIPISKLAFSGTPTEEKYLRSDGAWAVPEGSGSIQAPLSFWGFYKVDTGDTSAPASSGRVEYNNATQASATSLFINQVTNGGVDIDVLFTNLDTGAVIYIQDKDDSANYQIWEVSSTPSFASATWTIPVTLNTSGGTGTTNIPNNQEVFLAVQMFGGGGGDVVGPVSSTDGEIPLFDSTTGKLLKNSNKVLTTVGGNIAALTNPSAVSFIRINADNTVTARSASDFRSDIGAQETLVSGTNIKTINSTSLLGSGDITISTLGAWSLANGGTLTGVNTITSNSPNQLVFTGSYTSTASNQYLSLFSGTLTSRNTASDRLNAYRFTPSLTATAANQILSAVSIQPTFATGGNSNISQRSLEVIGTTVIVDTSDTTKTLQLYGTGTISYVVASSHLALFANGINHLYLSGGAGGIVQHKARSVYENGFTIGFNDNYTNGPAWSIGNGSLPARAVRTDTGLTSANGYIILNNGTDIASRVNGAEFVIGTGNGASSSARNAGNGGDLIFDLGRGGTGTGFSNGNNGRLIVRPTTSVSTGSLSGLVGIGVSPTYILHVKATGANQNIFSVEEDGGVKAIEVIESSGANRIGLFNATPQAQATTGIAAATFVANTSAIVDDTATFDGYTIGQVVKALRNIGLLA
jgi:hypothetical protein